MRQIQCEEGKRQREGECSLKGRAAIVRSQYATDGLLIHLCTEFSEEHTTHKKGGQKVSTKRRTGNVKVVVGMRERLKWVSSNVLGF